ncbi:MAG TPA: hypothetical protein VES19_14765 [Candidatus Limnocylindrales bacterium]|nr:hypothetical protein [Candidatus Limnocylindrales bacterium]
MNRSWARLVVLGTVLMAVNACGSGSTATPAAPTTGPASPAPVATVASTPVPEPSQAATEAPADLVPGAIAFRVVNLTASPVDVWIRSQGLVRAEPAVTGLAPDGVTPDLFPPDPGEVVVLPAGTGDATCVADCAFLGSTTTGFGDGDRRVLVVREDGATEYWEHPAPASIGASSNALPLADPAKALLIAEAGAVTDGAFGLRMGPVVGRGCLFDETGSADTLLGGTVVLAYDAIAEGDGVQVHAGSDAGCTEDPVGGPFPVDTTAGSRTLLLLSGAQGSMRAIPVPLP